MGTCKEDTMNKNNELNPAGYLPVVRRCKEKTMKTNERNRKCSATGLRLQLALAAMICLCLVAIAPAVALYPDPPFIDEQPVTVSNSTYYGTFDDVAYNQSSFFGICGLVEYGYNWTTGSYPDRKPLYNLTIEGTVYPEGNGIIPTNYQWNIVDALDKNATLYKKGLAGYVNQSGTYYLWYGNDTAARSFYSNRSDWLFPTVENATYIVQLDVTYNP